MFRPAAIRTGGTVGQSLDVSVSEFETDATFGGGDHFTTFDGRKVDLVARVRDLNRLLGFTGCCVERVAHDSSFSRGRGRG